MSDSIRKLLDSCEAITGMPGVEVVRSPDLEAARDAVDLCVEADAEQLFKDVTGASCPDLLKPFLCLSDTVDMAWRSNGTAGEMKLAQPIVAMGNSLPAAYAGSGFDAAQVARLRILDEVADVASTSFVLFDAEATDRQGLILFDTRAHATLPLSGEDYLRLSTTGFAFDSWQYLFSSLTITPDRRARIDCAMAEVRRLFPDRDLSAFDAAKGK
jgi:hypothetical protein